MYTMSYRYDFLLSDGSRGEGWAHSAEDMLAQVKAEFPDLECRVWLSGGAPKHLTYSELLEAERLTGGDEKLIRLIDDVAGGADPVQAVMQWAGRVKREQAELREWAAWMR